LRSREDIEALRQGLRDGTIDSIATDHAPQSIIEKDVEFSKAANGVVGLETAFSVIYGLVEEGVMTLERAIEAMTVKPSEAMGLDTGTLRVGSSADITIIDLKKSWTVRPENFCSKSRNTPYAGKELKARVVKTIYAGEVVYGAD